MAEQVTKRCHWVAQSYLKAFAADEDRQRIWRLSRGEASGIHSGHPWPSPYGQLRCAHLSGPRLHAGARRRAAVPRETPPRPADVSNPVRSSTNFSPPDTQKPPFGGPCVSGGSGEIRTHGGRKPTAVFKTAALNHSATLPYSLGSIRPVIPAQAGIQCLCCAAQVAGFPRSRE